MSVAAEQELLAKLEEINEFRRTKKKEIKGRIHDLSYWKHVRPAIGYIYHHGKIRINDLVNKLGIHIKDIEDVIGMLVDLDLVSRRGIELRLTMKGEQYAMSLGFKPRDRILSPDTKSKIIELLYNFIQKDLPPPDPYLYQWYFDPESVINVLDLMVKELDVEGAKVACLMTPTLGLAIHHSGLASEVCVLDVDENIVNILKTKYGVSTVKYNIEEPVPHDYRERYDLVIIDPPYEEQFYYVSFCRALELLRDPKDKVVYCVIPPPEIAYLIEPGYPPLINAVFEKMKEVGLTIEAINKGLCEYITPPFEMAVLYRRLQTREVEMLRKWRRSDLLKARVYRRSISPLLKERVELQQKELNKYRRIKRNPRFLVRLKELDSYKGLRYTRPDVETPHLAKKWDEINITDHPLEEPYLVLIHDIGTWEEPENRLIKLKSFTAHFLWKYLENIDEINDDIINQLVKSLIAQGFSDMPSEDQIRNDVVYFIQRLREYKLLN